MKEKLFPLMSLLLMVGMTGCSGMKNSMRLSEKNSAWNPLQQLSKERKEKQEEDAKPVTMAAIWADSVYEKTGEPSVRGFGGRIFFYDENNTSVKADGELIVYGFDDSVKNKTEDSAQRKFVFTRDKFQSHFSENDLGASYSVWVPWEKMGGFRKSITLIPMFKTAEGALIKCSQSICTLPGRILKEEEVAESNEKQPYKVLGPSPAVVSQADYQSGTPVQSADPEVARTDYQSETQVFNRVKTSTIRITPSMARRMAQANLERGRAKIAETERQAIQQAPSIIESKSVAKTGSVKQSEVSQKGPKLDISSRQQGSTNQDKPAFGQPGAWN